MASALAVLTVLMSGLVLASAAGAQARVKEKVNVAVTGEILAIDAAARTLKVKSTNDEGVDYVVDGSSTVMRGGQNIPLADLKVGWSVVMNGHDDGTQKLVTMIKVVKAPTD